VKKRQREDRKSAGKEMASQEGEGKEELDFMFDEDLDMPQGRQNKFSSV
jgi:hypothetical protein